MEEKVIEIIKKMLWSDKKIELTSNLKDDLDVDSLELVELLMAIEEEFNISITDDIAAKVQDVKDLVDITRILRK